MKRLCAIVILALASFLLIATHLVLIYAIDAGRSLELVALDKWSLVATDSGFSISRSSTEVFWMPPMVPGAVLGMTALILWLFPSPARRLMAFAIKQNPRRALPMPKPWRRKPWERHTDSHSTRPN